MSRPHVSTEAVAQKCSVKNVFLNNSPISTFQHSQESTCAIVSYLMKLPASGEILKNNFFYRTPPVAAFVSTIQFGGNTVTLYLLDKGHKLNINKICRRSIYLLSPRDGYIGRH